MIADFMVQLIKTSLTSAMLIGPLLLMMPLLKKRYRAKWRYIAWVVIALRLLLPFNIILPQAPVRLELPEQTTIIFATPELQEESPNVLPQTPVELETVELESGELEPDKIESLEHNTQFPPRTMDIEEVHSADGFENISIPITTLPKIQFSPLEIAGFIWLVGLTVFLIFQLASYQMFLYKLKRSKKADAPVTIQNMVWQMGGEMGIFRLPRPVITDAVEAPVLVGILRPMILLPQADFKDPEIAFILRHELIHYRRKDMWFKLILLLANALHWFNPLVRIMTIEAAKDIELSCDDVVVKELDFEERIKYGETIVSVLPRKRRLEPVFSTHFGSTKKNMKNRLQNLVDMNIKRRGFVALCIVSIFALSITSMVTVGFAASTSKNTMIHAKAVDGTWASATTIEGSTQKQQMDAEIKWLSETSAQNKGNFVITESLPKTELYDVSRVRYLYDNSQVFNTMSQMTNGRFQVENGQSFARFGAAYSADMIQRTAVMVNNDLDISLDINFNLTQGKLAVWLIDPAGNAAYASELSQAATKTIAIKGQKGLWAVVTMNDGAKDGYMQGKMEIALSQPDLQSNKTFSSEAFSIERLGQHTFQTGDTLVSNLNWDGAGSLLLLYTDKNYTDDEILAPLQGISGMPKPNYNKIDKNKSGGIFNFSQAVKSPLVWNNTSIKPGSYYFYLIRLNQPGQISGNISRKLSSGILSDIWTKAKVQNDVNINDVISDASVNDVTASVSNNGTPFFEIISKNGKNVASSGSFKAKAGQTLTITTTSTIKGGSVDLFLFSPSFKEQRLTFSGTNETKTITLSEGTWAYNCTGFFESGSITITGTAQNEGTTPSNSTKDTQAYDKECLRIMEVSGTWGDSVENLLPYMSASAVEKVVNIYLDRHLFPNTTTAKGAKHVETTIEPAMKYMTKDAQEAATKRIKAYY